MPNLRVIKLMPSFKSKEHARKTFAWMHYYWYLTNDPSEIVHATLKKSTKPPDRLGDPPDDRPRDLPRCEGDHPRFGNRDGYRGGPRGVDFGGDQGGALADFQPSFTGSGVRFAFGRGGEGYSATPFGNMELHEGDVDFAWRKLDFAWSKGELYRRSLGFSYRAKRGICWRRGNLCMGPFGLPNVSRF